MISHGSWEVRCAQAKDLVQQPAVADKAEAAVVGYVQPFVAVGNRRVGQLNAARQLGGHGGDPGEESEGAVHVQPGVVPVGQGGEPVDGIKPTGIDLAGGGPPDRPRAAVLSERTLPVLPVDAARWIP